MLFSIAEILLIGMFMGYLFKKIGLPSLTGMLITGIILGPFALNFIDSSILNISIQLRKIALIIILAKAGLSLDLKDLKKVGRPAILMCFLPACFEIFAMVIFAPKLLNISVLDAAIIGSVVGAVSPAVIVPKMLKLMEEGYGVRKSIPQLILAGASFDDVFVIVVFSIFTSLAKDGIFSYMSIINLPVSIVSGIFFGFLFGFLLLKYFEKFKIDNSVKMIIILCISFLFVSFEDKFGKNIPFASLLAVMSMTILIKMKKQEVSKRLAAKFNQLWIVAEVILFVLVGANVDVSYIEKAGIISIFLIFIVLSFRMLGVMICLIKTNLSFKERIFCMLGYCPKATVQAAIGGIPLAMGLDCGNIVLAIAVCSIIITAPLGAFLIELTYKKLLSR